MCRRHLNLGFQRVEKIQSQYLKEMKAKLPRRESARRHHRYARHCDILTAIDTRCVNIEFFYCLENVYKHTDTIVYMNHRTTSYTLICSSVLTTYDMGGAGAGPPIFR